MSQQELLDKLKEALLEGDEDATASAAQAAVDGGLDPQHIIKEAINKPMELIGKQFQEGEIFLPELIMIGDAARVASDVIIPYISTEDQNASAGGKVVIGTIQGDMHDIGKSIVAAYLMATGFKVRDLGVDVSPKAFVQAAVDEKADVVAISTLLSTTVPLFNNILSTLVDSGQREKFYVIVGGGPVTPEWAADIGADGYGRDAGDAAELVQKMLDGDKKPPFDKPIVLGALK